MVSVARPELPHGLEKPATPAPSSASWCTSGATVKFVDFGDKRCRNKTFTAHVNVHGGVARAVKDHFHFRSHWCNRTNDHIMVWFINLKICRDGSWTPGSIPSQKSLPTEVVIKMIIENKNGYCFILWFTCNVSRPGHHGQGLPRFQSCNPHHPCQGSGWAAVWDHSGERCLQKWWNNYCMQVGG